MITREEFHYKIGLNPVLVELGHPDEVGVAEFHPELCLMHEGLVFVAILGTRRQQLFEGKRAVVSPPGGLP